jgi:hypothetical protein
MNSASSVALVRRSTLAVILAGAALLLGACSTASVSSVPLEKTVSYKQLHGLMTKLAEEPAYGSAQHQTVALAKLSPGLGSGTTLASNQ